MRSVSSRLFILLISGSFLVSSRVVAQAPDADALKAAYRQDSLFWVAYNQCDSNSFSNFFADDIEFYHDKGGVTLGKQSMTASLKKGICGNSDMHIRREVMQGTEQVFAMKKSNELYGALITGEHIFYIKEKGKPEVKDGHGRFADLWTLINGKWKMTRVLSFDHGPAK